MQRGKHLVCRLQVSENILVLIVLPNMQRRLVPVLKLRQLHLISSSDEESESCSDVSVSDSDIPSLAPPSVPLPNDDVLFQCLEQSCGNWFQFGSEMEETHGVTDFTVLEEMYDRLLPKLKEKETELLTQSHSAYMHVHNEELPLEQRNVDVLNGLVVSESEAEDPDAYLPNREIGITDQRHILAQNRMLTLRRAARRRCAK